MTARRFEPSIPKAPLVFRIQPGEALLTWPQTILPERPAGCLPIYATRELPSHVLCSQHANHAPKHSGPTPWLPMTSRDTHEPHKPVFVFYSCKHLPQHARSLCNRSNNAPTLAAVCVPCVSSLRANDSKEDDEEENRKRKKTNPPCLHEPTKHNRKIFYKTPRKSGSEHWLQPETEMRGRLESVQRA